MWPVIILNDRRRFTSVYSTGVLNVLQINKEAYSDDHKQICPNTRTPTQWDYIYKHVRGHMTMKYETLVSKYTAVLYS